LDWGIDGEIEFRFLRRIRMACWRSVVEIHEMKREECLQVLAATRLARLACAFENQPYVVPVYVAYYAPPGEEACLYGFATPGQKIEWMRTNPLVCVEVDEVESYDQWVSVIVLGRYEELAEPPVEEGERLPARAEQPRGSSTAPLTTEGGGEALLAHQVLQAKGMWWEPAATAWASRTHRDRSEPFTLVYYKVRIDKVTGHRATRDDHDACTASARAAFARKLSWLRKVMMRLCGGSPS
jgi:nitroimidazol reductase NimA-like FMN-containing flavoprotein (pyridoxamine 5'-phosphate oxidase superfamily)